MTDPSTNAGAPALQGITAVSGAPTAAGLRHASALKGHAIVNRAGETLGEVEDIVLDVQRGCIAYVVMGSGGFLGIGEKLFAIPWSALTLDGERPAFLIDADKSTFDNAPGFDAEWPTQLHGGEAWHRDVHAFYGTQTYWERS